MLVFIIQASFLKFTPCAKLVKLRQGVHVTVFQFPTCCLAKRRLSSCHRTTCDTACSAPNNWLFTFCLHNTMFVVVGRAIYAFCLPIPWYSLYLLPCTSPSCCHFKCHNVFETWSEHSRAAPIVEFFISLNTFKSNSFDRIQVTCNTSINYNHEISYTFFHFVSVRRSSNY